MDTRAPFPWRQLLHRWFVEYNPLYLLSAALVLGGVHLLYEDLIQAGDLVAELGVPAIAELYAVTLIGGAALLTRIGLRRPAVLLALLAVLYQGDLTLLTETSVYLGSIGTAAAAIWVGVFAAKIGALAWALRLRLSRAAFLVPLLGALGLAFMPRLLASLGSEEGTLALGAFTFAIFAFGAFTTRAVESEVELDDWGKTVLRRSLAAVWAIWSSLLLLHVLFWSSERSLSSAILLPVALLVATRFVRREVWVWAAVTGAIASVALWMPPAMWLVALLSAITLGLRALRQPYRHVEEAEEPPSRGPYRQPDAPPPSPLRERIGFCQAAPAAKRRLLTGALAATYLGLWTVGWSGGPLPEHRLILDALFALVALGAFNRLRLREPLFVLAAVGTHYAVAAGLLAAPDTRVEWGLASVGAGFALLLASLAVSYRLRPLTRP